MKIIPTKSLLSFYNNHSNSMFPCTFISFIFAKKCNYPKNEQIEQKRSEIGSKNAKKKKTKQFKR